MRWHFDGNAGFILDREPAKAFPYASVRAFRLVGIGRDCYARAAIAGFAITSVTFPATTVAFCPGIFRNAGRLVLGKGTESAATQHNCQGKYIDFREYAALILAVHAVSFDGDVNHARLVNVQAIHVTLAGAMKRGKEFCILEGATL